MTEYKLKYKFETEDDRIAKKQDTNWHKVHEFGKGYRWDRYSDDSSIYAYELSKRNIEYNDFPYLEKEIQEKLISEIKKEQNIQKEECIKKSKNIKFNNINMPNIKQPWPDIKEIFK